MGTDGRIEKRPMVEILVHIAPTESTFVAETATTINISQHGARILTCRRWRLGELLDLTSLSGKFQRQGTVIYCYPLNGAQFCVGLEFNASVDDWREASWASIP